jgi:magnesium-transporting ATPase (P-type)
MQKFVTIAKRYGVLGLSLVLPAMASAQLTAPPGSVTAPQTSVTTATLNTSICNAINWLFYGLLVLTVVFVLIAAFRYLTSAGDPEKVKAAGHTILYACVAVAVALIARAVPAFVASVTGIGYSATICS